MRFIVKHIAISRSGASDLTRYVARSKLDPAREGRAARPLFTPQADRLSFGPAREWLSITGGEWANRDALHYVLSFAEAREYELLGDDEPERQAAIRAALRQALALSLERMGLAEMRWAAGLHRNTAHPHLHLLLNKNAARRDTGDLVYIPRLHPDVLPHNIRQPDGAKVFTPGLLASVFAAQVDERHRDRARWLEFTNPLHETVFTRALLAPETLFTRPPTPVEQLAGQWLLTALRLNPLAQVAAHKNQLAETAQQPNQPDETRAWHTLHAALAQLDKAALAHGQPFSPAYLNNEELRAVLLAPPTHWHVTPHRQSPAPENLPLRLWSPATLPERAFPATPAHAVSLSPETPREARTR